MTITHLVFALMTTAYILVAIQFEERDLIRLHPEYAAYRKQVPMIVPGMPRRVVIPQAAMSVLRAQQDSIPDSGQA